MRHEITSINLQHDNGCPFKTNEGYIGVNLMVPRPLSASSTSQSEIVNIVLVMAVDEEINENYSKVPAEPKYCGLWASRLREYMQDFIYLSRSIVYY